MKLRGHSVYQLVVTLTLYDIVFCMIMLSNHELILAVLVRLTMWFSTDFQARCSDFFIKNVSVLEGDDSVSCRRHKHARNDAVPEVSIIGMRGICLQ